MIKIGHFKPKPQMGAATYPAKKIACIDEGDLIVQSMMPTWLLFTTPTTCHICPSYPSSSTSRFLEFMASITRLERTTLWLLNITKVLSLPTNLTMDLLVLLKPRILMLAKDDGGIEDVRALLEDDVERAGVDGGGKGIKITARADVNRLGGSSSLAEADIETVFVLTVEGGGGVFRRTTLHLFQGRLLCRLTSSLLLVLHVGPVGGCLKLGGDAAILLEAFFGLLYMRGLV